MLPCVTICLFRPWPPQPHSSGRENTSHVIPTHTGRYFPPKEVRLGSKKSCQNSNGNAPGSSETRILKASMPALNFSRPKPVPTTDCRRENCSPLISAPNNAFRELMTSRATRESDYSSGRRLETLPSSGSVELVTLAAAADLEAEALPLPGNLAFTRFHVTSLLDARGCARGPRGATDTPPEWRHADHALSYLVTSVAS